MEEMILGFKKKLTSAGVEAEHWDVDRIVEYFFIISEADTLWLVLMYLDLPFCVIRIFTLYVPSSFR